MFIVPKEDSSNPQTAEATLDQRFPLQTSPSACCSADSDIPKRRERPETRKEPLNSQMSVLSVCHHHPSAGYVPSVVSGPSDSRFCFSSGQAQSQAFRDEEYSLSNQSDEEELEAPLPLRSEDDWQRYNPCSHMHHYGHAHTSCSALSRYPPHICHPPAPCHQTHSWHQSPHPNWRLKQEFVDSSSFVPACSVSVNVPHFSVPPAEGVSQASMGQLASGSLAQERRRGGGLPEECRNIFITYSSDTSSEILPFAQFLTKQGFRTTIDILDTPVNCTDINSWRDGFLKDPSTLIIIAISPKYKADVDGTAVDNPGLHTKYIHSMMQHEFIQQGSLNFRFIPVLFLSASKEHVPTWLQNTGVYRWPHHTEDLLLRLLRRERYAPPPVAMELNVVIKPVPLCATAPTL